MGDAKLVAVMGLVLGSAVAPALLVALLSGTVVGIGVMARHGVGRCRRTAIPFGPFLALGGVVASVRRPGDGPGLSPRGGTVSVLSKQISVPRLPPVRVRRPTVRRTAR